jgi:sulfate adenylyltransferase
VPPHGGTLVDRRGDPPSDLERLERIELSARERSDVELLACGALSPLTGFMGRDDYDRVLDEMRLANGLPWALPV